MDLLFFVFFLANFNILKTLTLFGACWVFCCYHNPPIPNMDYRIFNMRMWSFCMRVPTGGPLFTASSDGLVSLCAVACTSLSVCCCLYVSLSVLLLVCLSLCAVACMSLSLCCCLYVSLSVLLLVRLSLCAVACMSLSLCCCLY